MPNGRRRADMLRPQIYQPKFRPFQLQDWNVVLARALIVAWHIPVNSVTRDNASSRAIRHLLILSIHIKKEALLQDDCRRASESGIYFHISSSKVLLSHRFRRANLSSNITFSKLPCPLFVTSWSITCGECHRRDSALALLDKVPGYITRTFF